MNTFLSVFQRISSNYLPSNPQLNLIRMKVFKRYCTLFTAAVLLLSSQIAFAQSSPDTSDSYLSPPESIAEEVLAPSHLNVTFDELSPDGEWFLNRKRDGITSLSRYAKPHYNIAGLQIDRQANRSRSLTTQRASTGLELIHTKTGEPHELSVPDGLTISHPQWSPDGSQLAWVGHSFDESHIYVTDAESGETKQVTETPLLFTLNTSFQWTADGENIITVLLPEDRGDKPVRPATPTELQVRTTSDGENRLRTYQTLLKDKFEGKLLEYYVTGQLSKIEVGSGNATSIGEPAMIRNINAAPSGEHIIVQTLQKPFSYIVPVSRFSWDEEIWDLDGNVLATLRTSDVNKSVPDHDVLEDYGRRDIQWRPDGDGLSLLIKPEDEDEEKNGNSNNSDEDSDVADRVVQWLSPFGDDDQNVIYESDNELRSVSYSQDGEALFITERVSGDEHLFAFYTDQPDTTYTIYSYDRDDFYANPGSLSHRAGSLGIDVVRITEDGSHVFLSGTEYFEEFNEEAPRPFIDRVEIESGDKERIFRSSDSYYESVAAILDRNADGIIIERQSAGLFPNFWYVDLSSGDRNQLTENVDYNEAVTQATRERFKVKRADGFELWMDVVLPGDWDGEPLPGIIWHYPREYDDQDDYNEGLRRHNINRYPRVGTRTADIFVKEGYAVLRPDWPIVGDRGTSNDNFVWSVVQNSTAVIDSAEARGYIDRSKMAIGGHSYGAFGTANAMIHTSFFKAGIAGAGNYNRTLTPLGFQRERADLWRGMDRYLQMSPIFWADRLDGAFLMYHGEEDQNVGTWPTNSRRMFHALNGMDKTAALYMYPHEAHGPSAEETLLDLWTRWVEWLDYYVK